MELVDSLCILNYIIYQDIGGSTYTIWSFTNSIMPTSMPKEARLPLSPQVNLGRSP